MMRSSLFKTAPLLRRPGDFAGSAARNIPSDRSLAGLEAVARELGERTVHKSCDLFPGRPRSPAAAVERRRYELAVARVLEHPGTGLRLGRPDVLSEPAQ